jgi:DinB superfamily
MMQEHIDIEKLRFPVGKFRWPREYEEGKLKGWIRTIEEFPEMMNKATADLSDEELDWRYRPDGWTIRQVVHHCADSHINATVRFKLAMTEDNPTIVPYLEAKWAELGDMTLKLKYSIEILKGLHFRWGVLLKSLSEDDWARTYVHPEHNKTFNLFKTLAMYDWHCRHHLAHVNQALEYKGKFN